MIIFADVTPSTNNKKFVCIMVRIIRERGPSILSRSDFWYCTSVASQRLDVVEVRTDTVFPLLRSIFNALKIYSFRFSTVCIATVGSRIGYVGILSVLYRIVSSDPMSRLVLCHSIPFVTRCDIILFADATSSQ